MPRAIWTGSISFGLVNVPVKVYSAVHQQDIHFNQFEEGTGARIKYKRVSEKSGKEVPWEKIVKGYEVSKGKFVTIEPEELEAFQPKATRTIDIEDFVELDQIDPVFYDHPYYLAPDTGATKAYRLLVDAMKESGRVAIARIVLRSKEHLVAIRPRDDVLTMETMLFADEVVPPDTLDEVRDDAKAKTTKRELDMARQLIESLSGDFEPDKYRDEYRDRVLELIERKAEGEEVVLEAPPEEPRKVPDLMAALEASIAAAKRQGGERREESPRRAASADGAKGGGRRRSGAGARSSSKRKTAKKS